MFKKCMVALFLIALIFNNASGMHRLCMFNCHQESEKEETKDSDELYRNLKKIMNYITDQNINKRHFNNGNTILNLAISYGYLDIVNDLLKVDAIDVTVENNDNVPPILMALITGNNDIITAIYKKFPDQTDQEKLEEYCEETTLQLSENSIITIKQGISFINTLQTPSLRKPSPYDW